MRACLYGYYYCDFPSRCAAVDQGWGSLGESQLRIPAFDPACDSLGTRVQRAFLQTRASSFLDSRRRFGAPLRVNHVGQKLQVLVPHASWTGCMMLVGGALREVAYPFLLMEMASSLSARLWLGPKIAKA